jgi:hypothetical protein
MPVVRRDRAFAVNEIVENIVEGLPIAKVARPSRVRLFAVASSAGDIFMDLLFGSRTILQRGEPNLQATAGVTLEDLIVDDVALPGEDITLRCENVDGVAAPTLRYRIEKHALR